VSPVALHGVRHPRQRWSLLCLGQLAGGFPGLLLLEAVPSQNGKKGAEVSGHLWQLLQPAAGLLLPPEHSPSVNCRQGDEGERFGLLRFQLQGELLPPASEGQWPSSPSRFREVRLESRRYGGGNRSGLGKLPCLVFPPARRAIPARSQRLKWICWTGLQRVLGPTTAGRLVWAQGLPARKARAAKLRLPSWRELWKK